jgi:hypothetical protein
MEQQVSTLQGLKLITAKRQTAISPAHARRLKLVGRIEDQIALAQATIEQRTYTKERVRNIRNESGVRTSVQIYTRVKPWWWSQENGKWALTIRYGSRVIALSAKSNAIECATLKDIIQALSTVKAAVESGELDPQISAASDKLRQGFTG